MSVRCNYCDRRGKTPATVSHTDACPFNRNAQSCVECGLAGQHAERCPLVHDVRRVTEVRGEHG